MSMSGTQPTQAGWYPDPSGSGGQRWHDGEGWTAQVTQASAVRSHKPLGHNFAVLGDWLARLLLVNAGLSVLTLLVNAWGYTKVQGVVAGGPVSMSDFENLDMATSVLGFLTLGLYVFTGVVWLVWQSRLATSAPRALRHGPGMHVAAWFIPFVSIVVPIRNMGDLWRSYEPSGPQDGPPPISMLMPWALFWIAGNVTAGLSLRAHFSAVTLQTIETQLLLRIASDLTIALAAICACMVVHRMSWRALVFWAALDAS